MSPQPLGETIAKPSPLTIKGKLKGVQFGFRASFPCALPHWMGVPSAEAPGFAGMTEVTHTSRSTGEGLHQSAFLEEAG